MDISIIVPCKELGEYIKPLLISFHMLNISNIEYEILFVFDEDNDSTIDIIHQHMKDMNYRIIFNPDQYPGTARNRGLNVAQGDYIWFVDGDDWIINPDVIQQVLPLLKKNDENIIQITFVSNFFKMQHYSMVWQYIFKKEFLSDIVFNTELHYEDNDFMQKVFKKLGTTEVLCLTIPSYFYNYERPNSLTYNMRRGLG